MMTNTRRLFWQGMIALLGIIVLWLGTVPIPFASAQDTNKAVSTTTATPSSAANAVLVWWPVPLYPAADSTAEALLIQYLERYRQEHGVVVNVRLKRAEGIGSIYSTLVNASVVAPSVVPDLTLMRRSDLLRAVAARLVMPVDLAADIPGIADGNWFAVGVAMGKVQGVQYGIPYMLEVQHAIYRRSTLSEPPLTFARLLESRQPYLFPANAGRSVNPTLLAQYLAAGGRVTDSNGVRTLDRGVLLTVLRYYERAVLDGLISPEILTYTQADQYWPALESGMIQIDSTAYLNLTTADLSGITLAQWGYTVVPGTNPTDPVTVVDGWVWVITTDDPTRRAQALALVTWLMDTRRQANYTREMGFIPAQQSALQNWNNDYAAFVEPLLTGRTVPPIDTIDTTVALALQTAFEDVLNGRKPAETAANDALAQVIQSSN